jgi:hypothetical protein
MNFAQLKQTWQEQPFKPFTLHMSNGQKWHIPHPEFMWMFPDEATIVIADEKHRIGVMIDVSHINTLVFESRTARRTRKSTTKKA